MAITLTLAHAVTDEELLVLSERNPGYEFERTAAGDLVVTPTGTESAYREGLLFLQLGAWATSDGHGRAFPAGAGFQLPNGFLYAPDASWVRSDRWEAVPKEQRRTFARLCPDVVFEIRSESQSLRELRDKARVYVAAGAALVVLIDPYERIVEMLLPGSAALVQASPATVSLDPELPGFILDLAPIFAS